MNNNIYCRNCGKRGHKYKDCLYPRLSYGIVLFNDKKEIVMIERKDSISFIEFIRGKYKLEEPEYIQLLFNRMSVLEKVVLLNSSFNNLWNNLWYNQNSNKDYSKSFNKFKKVNIKHFIDNSTKNYLYNEWEIPKGRRNMNETDLDCAIREFKEETNIPPNKYKIIDHEPFMEEYIGSNNITYKNVYYVGKISDYDLIINKNNIDQISEIKSIEWINKEEYYLKIRDYSDYKINVIKEIFKYIYNI